MFEKIAISLLKGIIYKEDDIKLWEGLLESENEIREYFAKINLELIIDKDFAYLTDLNEEYKLTRKIKLSFFSSFLLVLLREELLKENEIITKEDIYQKFAIYIENKDEKKLRQNIDSAVNSLVKLTFLKEIENGVYKIRNSVESFCNVKYLGEFDKKLEEYVSKLREKGV
jgi:hypothetical protein